MADHKQRTGDPPRAPLTVAEEYLDETHDPRTGDQPDGVEPISRFVPVRSEGSSFDPRIERRPSQLFDRLWKFLG